MPDIVTDVASADAQALIEKASSPETLHTVLEAASADVRKGTMDHFSAREEEPENTAGFPKFGQSFGKRGFWSGTNGQSVREAVKAPTFDDGEQTATILIDSPKLAHKANPNPPPIVPTGGRRSLTIPANARAAAWAGMPRDFSVAGGMKFGFAKTPEGNLMPALVASQDHMRVLAKGKRNGALVSSPADKATTGAGAPQFWLVRSVQTRYDPKAMPDQEVLSASANARAATVLAQLLQ
jgi:hypothetical protein